MSHIHFCDVAGHYWECDGSALRSLTGKTEPSICICEKHRVPMEEGDHSECPIELLACPEHRGEQLKATCAAIPAESNLADLFTVTDAQRIKFEEDRRFMQRVVFAGLANLNTGFDSPLIYHFSPADFGKVIDLCEHFGVRIIGVEVFIIGGGMLEVEISEEGGFEWTRRLVQRYQQRSDITICATFDVPDSAKSGRPALV